MTLIELLVVLVILAVLAAMALRATDSVVEQARVDASGRTLDALDAAVLGNASDRDAGGRRLVSGFLADVGRPPHTVDELLEAGAIPPFAMQPVPGTPGAQLGVGWRGPYVTAATTLQDGWARPIDVELFDSVGDSFDQCVSMFRSVGADGLAGGNSYDADIERELFRTGAGAFDRCRAGLQGAIDVNPEAFAREVTLRLYGPVDGAINVLREVTVSLPADAEGTAYSLDPAAIGSRLLLAWIHLPGPPPATGTPCDGWQRLTLTADTPIATLDLDLR
ncbi:MAG: prepilin-type N-terminal cleavage/methylation domain-containing protein [Planctomycetota bacterium]